MRSAAILMSMAVAIITACTSGDGRGSAADDSFTLPPPEKTGDATPPSLRTFRGVLSFDDLEGGCTVLETQDGGTLVGISASGSADEQVTMRNPAAGTYDVYVNGFTTPGGTTSYHLANFVVPAADVGNASVTPNPASVTTGVQTTLTANWTGLDPAKRWFGVIKYTGSNDVTFLSVG